MPGNVELADELAVLTGSEAGPVETRHFPDGESYVRIHGPVGEEAFLVCTLAQPDEQFLRVIFAERAMRSCGAKKVTLIAPYLAYLRQDQQFHPGEAVSSRIFADLLSREFDGLVTVDPHLHRYASLAEVFSIPTIVVRTAAVIGDWIQENISSPVVIGPDQESAQWVEEVAESAGSPWAVFTKKRAGDRSVRLNAPDLRPFHGCTPVLVDDIISSGRTILSAAKALLEAGLGPAFCLCVHALFDDRESTELASLFKAILTTDSIPNRFSRFQVAPLIARQLG
jgi:ribose-phosphate pyrophosphokinase